MGCVTRLCSALFDYGSGLEYGPFFARILTCVVTLASCKPSGVLLPGCCSVEWSLAHLFCGWLHCALNIILVKVTGTLCKAGWGSTVLTQLYCMC